MIIEHSFYGKFEVPDEIEQKITETLDRAKNDPKNASIPKNSYLWDGEYWRMLGIYCRGGETALNDFIDRFCPPTTPSKKRELNFELGE